MNQILSRLTHKRPALQALLLARRFTDEHEHRALRPFTKDQRMLAAGHHAGKKCTQILLIRFSHHDSPNNTQILLS